MGKQTKIIIYILAGVTLIVAGIISFIVIRQNLSSNPASFVVTKDNYPAEGVIVRIGNESKRSDADGNVKFDNIPSNQTEVTIEYNGETYKTTLGEISNEVINLDKIQQTHFANNENVQSTPSPTTQEDNNSGHSNEGSYDESNNEDMNDSDNGDNDDTGTTVTNDPTTAPTHYSTPLVTRTPTPTATQTPTRSPSEVDTAGPSITSFSPAENYTLNQSSLGISFSASDQSGILKLQIQLDGEVLITCYGENSCFEEVPKEFITSGNHIISILAIDSSTAHNESRKEYTIQK